MTRLELSILELPGLTGIRLWHRAVGVMWHPEASDLTDWGTEESLPQQGSTGVGMIVANPLYKSAISQTGIP